MSATAPVMTTPDRAMEDVAATPAVGGVQWARVGLFLGLTFGATYILNLVLYLQGGLQSRAAGAVLENQMLLPAFVALLLGSFAFRESSVYHRTNKTASRWFVYFYLLAATVSLALTIGALAQPSFGLTAAAAMQALGLLALVIVVISRLAGGKNAFAGAGLAGGKWYYWLLFGAGLVLFYALGWLLNQALNLGTPVDLAKLLPMGSQFTSMPPTTLKLLLLVQSFVITPLTALMFGFGEEYGWRGYLQSELIRLGRVRGVLLIGIIWGLWHAPIILMGYNYPGYPVIGVIMMTAYTVLLGFVLSYAVLTARGIWIAAFLHMLNNNVLGFFQGILYAPKDAVFNFSLGLYGLALMAIVVLLILRDPVWRRRESTDTSGVEISA